MSASFSQIENIQHPTSNRRNRRGAAGKTLDVGCSMLDVGCFPNAPPLPDPLLHKNRGGEGAVACEHATVRSPRDGGAGRGAFRKKREMRNVQCLEPVSKFVAAEVTRRTLRFF